MAKQKQRMSRASKVTIDYRMSGGEPHPIVVTDSKDMNYRAALNWYNYHYSLDDTKAWLTAYAKANYSKEVAKAVASAPTKYISKTAAIQAKLIERGFVLSDDSMEFLNSRIEQLVNRRDDVDLDDDGMPTDTITVKPAVSPHTRLARKINNQLAEIEGLVDEHVDGERTFNFYTWATAESASPQLIAKVQTYYSSQLNEMVEHPEHFKTVWAKRSKQLFEDILADAKRLTVNKKVVRKPRVAAKPSTEKSVKGLKYKVDDHKLKLVSIKPTDIIGAKELWVYNTKYNELGVFVAKTHMGLRVKGTSIDDFDESKSLVKKVRKPEATLPEFFSGKPGKVFAALTSTPHALSARVGENSVLLKAVK
jgi:hypothetical protein